MLTHKNAQLNLSDRIEIKLCLDRNFSFRQIAKEPSVSPSTISGEIKRNSKVKHYCKDGLVAKYDCQNYLQCMIANLCKDCIRPFSTAKTCRAKSV